MAAPLPPPPSLQEVCDRALRLPCSPALLPRLLSVLSDPDSSADQIAQIIMIDASLAAATLRLANSVMFGGDGAVETLSDAVMRLGQRELFRLASLASLHRWEQGTSGRNGPGDFCRHALCTGIAAEAIAQATGAVDPDLAYTAALISNLGQLAIGNACGPFFPALDERCATTGCTWTEAERAILGFTHPDVGCRLLRAWKFPPLLVAAVEYSEAPRRAEPEVRLLAAHVHAAKYAATCFGPGAPANAFLFELDTEALADCGVTSTLVEETMTLLLERAQARLRDKLTHGPLPL